MRIVIPGIPVSQARMKHTSRRGFVSTYDPRAKQKKEIRAFLSALKVKKLVKNPRISFLYCMPIPKSVRKRDLPLYESGKLKHIKKPDADNLAKLYLDCLDGILFDGDQQVSLGPCIKVYDKEPRTIIWLNETDDLLQPWELDFAFLNGGESEIPSFSELGSLYDSCSLWLQVRSQFDCMTIPGISTQSLD